MALSPDSSPDHGVVGRFAPSPTGPLHFGSLYAALAGYLDVRARDGQWLVRMEDLDPPREVAGAREAIVSALEVHGLLPPGPMLQQSRRTAHYDKALQQLATAGHLFYCTCSRRDLAPGGGRYPGTCRSRTTAPVAAHAVRFRVPDDRSVRFEDALQGPQEFGPSMVDDFIVRRRDGLHAYHLAVVVDDGLQQVTTITRGFDLLDSTPRHLLLQESLGWPSPEYLHLPVLTRDGHKLSKQTGAPAVSRDHPADNLARALEWLGQPVPGGAGGRNVAKLLRSATACWDRRLLPKVAAIELPPDPAS